MTTDPLKVPSIQRAQSDPASTVQRASLEPQRPLTHTPQTFSSRSRFSPFLSRKLPRARVPLSRSSLALAFLSAEALSRSFQPKLSRARVLFLFSRKTPSRSCSASFPPSPAPSQLPPFLPEHAGNFQKEAFSRQIGDARTAAVVGIFPRRVKSTAATPFVRGRGGTGAACFPSSKARPLATVCRGRTRWWLRRRGWWLL